MFSLFFLYKSCLKLDIWGCPICYHLLIIIIEVFHISIVLQLTT